MWSLGHIYGLPMRTAGFIQWLLMHHLSATNLSIISWETFVNMIDYEQGQCNAFHAPNEIIFYSFKYNISWGSNCFLKKLLSHNTLFVVFGEIWST